MSSAAARRWRAVPRYVETRTPLRLAPGGLARRSPGHGARVPFVVLVTAVLLGGTIGLLLFNTSMQQAAFTGAALEERAGVLSARQQDLTREVNALRDPQRLGEAARANGMVPGPPPVFLDAETGRPVEGSVPTRAEQSDDLRIASPTPGRPAELDPPPVQAAASGSARRDPASGAER